MDMLVRFGFASAVSGLVLNMNEVASRAIFWKDTLEHRALSLCIVFVAITALLFFAFDDYVDSGYSDSKILLPLVTLFMLAIIAIGTLNIDVIIKLPQTLVTFADLWYAVPGAIGLYFATLFGINKFA